MTYYSKKALVSLVALVVVFIVCYLNGLGQLEVVGTDMGGRLAIWGGLMFVLLVSSIGVKIIVSILFGIVNGIITGNTKSEVLDERDQLIELKSVRNICSFFALGFFLGMGSLVLKQPLDVMFTIFAFTFLITGVVLEVSYIFYYEREA